MCVIPIDGQDPIKSAEFRVKEELSKKKCSLLKALFQWSFPVKSFSIAWKSSLQAENCPSQSILIPVSCQHLAVIKKWWSQLEWWTVACSRESREQGKMLVEHVSVSAFSWQHNFIQVPVLFQHCCWCCEQCSVWIPMELFGQLQELSWTDFWQLLPLSLCHLSEIIWLALLS